MKKQKQTQEQKPIVSSFFPFRVNCDTASKAAQVNTDTREKTPCVLTRKASESDCARLARNAVYGTLNTLFSQSGNLFILKMIESFSRDMCVYADASEHALARADTRTHTDTDTESTSTQERVSALRKERDIMNKEIASLQGKRKRAAEKLDAQVMQALQMRALHEHLHEMESYTTFDCAPYVSYEHLPRGYFATIAKANAAQAVKPLFKAIVPGIAVITKDVRGVLCTQKVLTLTNGCASDAARNKAIIARYYAAINADLMPLAQARTDNTQEIQDAEKQAFTYSDSMDLFTQAYTILVRGLRDGCVLYIDIDEHGNATENKTQDGNTLFPYKGKETYYDTDGNKHYNTVDKTRTLYGKTCACLRAYIAKQHKHTEKTIDLSALIMESDTESDTDTQNALDAHLYKGGKYHTTDNALDALVMRYALEKLDLTATQYNYIMMRLQGLSDAEIARKRNVTDRAMRNVKTTIATKACAVFDAETLKAAQIAQDNFRCASNDGHKHTSKETEIARMMRNALDTCFYAEMPHFCKDAKLDAMARAFYKGFRFLRLALDDAENRAKTSGKIQTAFPLVTETESGNKPCEKHDALPLDRRAKLCAAMASVCGCNIIPIYSKVFAYRDAQVNPPEKPCDLHALYKAIQAKHAHICTDASLPHTLVSVNGIPV